MNNCKAHCPLQLTFQKKKLRGMGPDPHAKWGTDKIASLPKGEIRSCW